MSASKGQYTAETVALVEGDIRTIRLTEDGRLMVDMSGAAAPTGVATAALQTTGNASLANIDADLELLKLPTTFTAITPSDSTNVTAICTKGIMVTVAGVVNVTGVGGSAVGLGTLPAGTIIPVALSRVNVATTATVVGLSGP